MTSKQPRALRVKPETVAQRDERHAEQIKQAWSERMSRPTMHPNRLTSWWHVYMGVRAAVYAVLPGNQRTKRSRKFMDPLLETAVKAACKALRRKA